MVSSLMKYIVPVVRFRAMMIELAGTEGVQSAYFVFYHGGRMCPCPCDVPCPWIILGCALVPELPWDVSLSLGYPGMCPCPWVTLG